MDPVIEPGTLMLCTDCGPDGRWPVRFRVALERFDFSKREPPGASGTKVFCQKLNGKWHVMWASDELVMTNVSSGVWQVISE